MHFNTVSTKILKIQIRPHKSYLFIKAVVVIYKFINDMPYTFT